MKSSRILEIMPRKCLLFLLILFFSSSRSQAQSPTGNIPPAGLLCISDCETCPVICSPPPPSAPPTPRSSSPVPPPPPLLVPLPPPPPVHHHSPPQPYYFDSPSPASSPPAHPPPSPPSYVSGGGPPTPPAPTLPWGGAFPTPPSVYVYNPGNTGPPGMGQRNFSYPYYYFYASKASCFAPLHQGFTLLVVVVIFFQVLCEFR